MRTIKFFLFAVAAMATISCAKEIAPDTNEIKGQNLTKLILIADSESCVESKAAFVNYPKIAWVTDDAISILGAKTGNKQFTTTSAGHSVTFEGMADLEDDKLYALYPYDGAVTLNEDALVNVTVPAVQKATAGNFDPKAYIAIAESYDKESLSFKAIGAFVKFNFQNFDKNIKSVTLMSNNGRTMAGTASKTTLDANGSTSHSEIVSGKGSTYVTLEGPFDLTKAYFMVIRPDTYEGGVTVIIELEDGTILSRKGKSALFESDKSRNYIRTMYLNANYFTEETEPYALYTLGKDIKIGDKVINKATYGEATIVTKTQGLDKSGVYFVNSDATANFNSGITGNLIVIGNTSGVRSNVSRTGTSYLTASEGKDALIMHNVNYVDCTANVFQLNAGTPFETIIFDNCLLNVASGKFLILSNSAANTITDFTMSNCDVKMDENVSLLKMGGSTINSLTFENNVLYADTEMTSFFAVNSTATAESVVFNNNTLYNTTIGTATTNEDAIVKANKITDFKAKNNYVVYANSTVGISTHRYFGRATFAGGEVDNNFYVRKASTNTAIYGVPGTMPAWVTNQPAVKDAPNNLTTNWDPKNGKYILGGYTGVGATR